MITDQNIPRPTSMFDQEKWHSAVAERLVGFARNPVQDMQLYGVSSLFVYLSGRTLEPFLETFPQAPVAAVLALASFDCGPGADHLVRRASALRYQAPMLLERELRSWPSLRVTVEQLI